MKMKMLSASSILGVILCSTFIFSCTKNQTNIAVSGVTLNKTSLSISPGNSEVLIATVTPTTANQTVTWKSSDDAVATVSSGKVTAVAKGVASITATSVGNTSKTATCAITVGTATFTLTSTSFKNNEWMDIKYACFDAHGMPWPSINVSPQLSWTGAPTTGVSKFIVMMYDTTMHICHFTYEISSTTTSLAEGDIPSDTKTNTNTGYIGPYPLGERNYHTYEFRVYAVSAGYDLNDFREIHRVILKSKSAKYILAYSDPGYLGKFKY